MFADKSRSDVYFSSRHTFDNGSWIHGSWIFPDLYFNAKTSRNLDQIANLERREPTLSGQFSLPLTNTVTLRPEIYLSAPDIKRSYSETDTRNHQGFTGTIALPFEVVLSRTDNAILTLSPTIYLHKPAFGGGNLQPHWPM